MAVMKRFAFLLLLWLPIVAIPQSGFVFARQSGKKAVIPFKYINNLIFIPLNVNGVDLTFLLDTGVDETILFSLDENQQIGLTDVRKVKLIGLGGSETVEGLISSGNKVSVRGLRDEDHDIYIVLDQGFNFSSNVGIPVNGIIGYHFFKNHAVEIDFEHRRIIVHRNDISNIKRFQKYKSADITIESNKPYVQAMVKIDRDTLDSKLLIDLGNSDAVWLFREKSAQIQLPPKHFSDYLGRGLSGDINGKRARMEEFVFCGYSFKKLIAAFPEDITTKSVTMVENRVGSVGAEILKRFRVVFDYPNGKLLLSPSKFYDAPFDYNMSGIEIHHDGVVYVREQMPMVTVKTDGFDMNSQNSPDDFRYKFELKPVYVIANVRKDSPAEQSGLKKGDILVSINGRAAYRYSLQELNVLLKSAEGRKVEIEVDRKNVILKYSFRLKSII